MTAPRVTGNQRGILLMVAGMGAFAVEDMFIKLAAADLPMGEILAILGIVGAAFFAALARRRGLSIWSRDALLRPVLARNLSEMIGTFGYMLAIALSPLTTATAIFQATPLVVTMGAALMLGETVGWRRWSAILVGLLGVMLVIRPGSVEFAATSLFAVLAVVGLSGRDLATRLVPGRVDSILLAAWAFVAVGLVGLVWVLATGRIVWPQGPAGLMLLGALVSGTLAYWLLTEATRAGEISVVTPFRYSRLLFAMVIGMSVFAERPDRWTLAGAALIVGSGIYSLLRERARARLQRESLSPASPSR